MVSPLTQPAATSYADFRMVCEGLHNTQAVVGWLQTESILRAEPLARLEPI
jgi:hypothetical protein